MDFVVEVYYSYHNHSFTTADSKKWRLKLYLVISSLGLIRNSLMKDFRVECSFCILNNLDLIVFGVKEKILWYSAHCLLIIKTCRIEIHSNFDKSKLAIASSSDSSTESILFKSLSNTKPNFDFAKF
ncbi:hypothetical protein BpHYR1_051128 [Brachionus plicatilis]|uniref:Uncharacterized protein n=1 Tax=Brachionus plicatilis TaxID=10195 RepID=A0A3M7PIP8_BRAPC|nr:hypothetical protein BpHYR1_051128 [Brachionus plicatilis]